MAADQGGKLLGLEEGSFVVHLELVLPESEVGYERKQLPKSAGRDSLVTTPFNCNSFVTTPI
ncbi:unnamed protein product [Prunus armeniaca]